MAIEETVNGYVRRSDSLDDIDAMIRNSGADEHSQITQSDYAITPGGKDAFQHLIGTCRLAPEIAGDIGGILADAMADGEVEMKDLPIDGMEFAGHLAISTMLVSNSVDGQNQETKAKMITGSATQIKKPGRWSRRGRGYEGGTDE